MPDLILPPVEQTVAITRNGKSQSVTSTPPAPAGLATGNTHYLKSSSKPWNGVSATVGQVGHGMRWAHGFAEPWQIEDFVVTAVDGNRFGAVNLDGFDSYTPARYIGGTAEVWRIVDGALEVVRASEVTGGNFHRWINTLAGNVAVTGTSGQFKFNNFNRPGYTYYFGVAAVDSGGQIGAIASVAYTPSSVASGDAASNTTTTLGSDWTTGGALAAPADLAATADGSGDALVNLSWSAVSGAVGYVLLRSYVAPAGHPASPYLELAADDVALEIGDLIWVKRRTMQPSIDMVTSRVWGAIAEPNAVHSSCLLNRLNKDTTHTVEYVDGETLDGPGTFARVTMGADVASTKIAEVFWAGGSGQSFYYTPLAGQSFDWRCRLKASRAVSLSHTFSGWTGTDPQTTTLNVTTEWQEFTVTFAALTTPTGTASEAWELRLTTTGAEAVTVDLDRLQMNRVGLAYGALEPEIAEMLVPGMFLRNHANIKNDGSELPVSQMTNPAGLSRARGYTLPWFLNICKTHSVRPWLQTEWHYSPSEWAEKHAYVEAPVSSGHPMALKRAAQGQTEPWSSLWDAIDWENSNETWNTVSGFQVMPALAGMTAGETYGTIARAQALAAQASPYWSGKIRWSLGGWTANNYGGEAASKFLLPCTVGITCYQGGWEAGSSQVTETDIGYQSALAAGDITIAPVSDLLVSRLQTVANNSSGALVYGETLLPTCYEGGPSFSFPNTLTKAEEIAEEVVMKSRAGATGTIKAFMVQAARGFDSGNYFTLEASGDRWTARAPASQGGQIFWAWQMLSIIQSNMDMPCRVHEASVVLDDGIEVDLQAGGTQGINKIFAYGLRSGSRFMLIVGNLSLTDTVKPTIRQALVSGATSCTVFPNVGDYREHNRYPEGQRLTDAGTYVEDLLCVHEDIAAQSVSVPSDLSRLVIDDALGATTDGIPPGCCVLVLLDGVR